MGDFQYAFVSFPQKKIYPGIGIAGMQFFHDGRCEHHIAGEGGLDNQELLHAHKSTFPPAKSVAVIKINNLLLILMGICFKLRLK